ncbi:hypothetical protein [uncultured Dechloromonas sp.]|uniref:hypothetical protein n=1 Tax=uncultured Dechloromonas sp. TaxID=171719 RepID=UPI0025E4719E|nr:hypothetical protein [uncultured Dechloromonas sp.]
MSRAAHRLVAVAAMVVALGAAAADKGWASLRGEALSRAFADQDLGDGVHFAYQFGADGELRGMNMGKAAQGRWRVSGNRLCWRWAKSREPEECHEVRRQGQAVRLFMDGQEVLSGNLAPLAGQRPAL